MGRGCLVAVYSAAERGLARSMERVMGTVGGTEMEDDSIPET